MLTATILAIACALFSVFMWFRPTLLYQMPGRLWDFAALCANPFERDLREPFLAYRITTPAFAWLVGLRGVSGVALQYAATLGFLAMAYLTSRRFTGVSTSAFLVFAASSSCAVIWSNGYPGFPDCVTHLCVVAAMFCSNRAAIAALLYAALMNDERAIVAMPFVCLWHAQLSGSNRVLEYARIGSVGALAIAMAAVTRHAMSLGWIGSPIEAPRIYGDMLAYVTTTWRPWDSTWPRFALNAFMAFRWLWIFPLWFAFAGGIQGVVRAAFLVALAMGMCASALVADVSRSIAFMFPAVLLSVVVLWRRNAEKTGDIAKASVLLQVATPVVLFVGDFSIRLHPLALEGIRMLAGGGSFSKFLLD